MDMKYPKDSRKLGRFLDTV